MLLVISIIRRPVRLGNSSVAREVALDVAMIALHPEGRGYAPHLGAQGWNLQFGQDLDVLGRRRPGILGQNGGRQRQRHHVY